MILEERLPHDQPLPTIRKLAQRFNTSVMTVQKAVKALSEEDIIEAKRGKGLFVKPSVRSEKTNNRIGLVFPQRESYLNSSPYPKIIIDTIRKRIAKHSLSLEVCSIHSLNESEILKFLQAKDLGGILSFEVESERILIEMKRLKLPIISLDYDAFRIGISSVVYDNTCGCFDATKYLIDCGHKHIAMMSPYLSHNLGGVPHLDYTSEQRTLGYRMAMHSAGLENSIEEYPHDKKLLKEKCLQIFGRRPTPTAIVCAVDQKAIAIANIAIELGFKIPEELSIIGFGDIGLKISSGQRLASVSIDMKGMGEQAVNLLVNQIYGKENELRRILLSTQIKEHKTIRNLRNKSMKKVQIILDKEK